MRVRRERVVRSGRLDWKLLRKKRIKSVRVRSSWVGVEKKGNTGECRVKQKVGREI